MATSVKPAPPTKTEFRSVIVTAVVLVPVIYAIAIGVAFGIDRSLNHNALTITTLSFLKIATVVTLVVGVHRVGSQIRERPSMAPAVAGIWATTGVFLVAAVAWAKEHGAILGVDHLWPSQTVPEQLNGLGWIPGANWQPATVAAAEIVAVVALSIGAAAILRLLAHRTGRGLTTAFVVAGLFGGLLIYDRIVGWPVMFDYDAFVGDAVLGALSYELFFFVSPVDPVGAAALATIAVANGLVLVVAASAPTYA